MLFIFITILIYFPRSFLILPGEFGCKSIVVFGFGLLVLGFVSLRLGFGVLGCLGLAGLRFLLSLGGLVGRPLGLAVLLINIA
jgi:hypothetical protein